MNESSEPEIVILSKDSGFRFIHKWYEFADASHFWMRWRLAAFLKQAKALNVFLKEPKLGAEIGCGHGVLRSQIMALTPWTVDGMDLDLNALKLNRPGRGRLYLYNILERNEELKEKYNFLFLYDVLEHIPHRQPFLEACLFHLKKGGYLFINVPALQCLKSAYDTAAGHCLRYSKKSLTDELNRLDLTIMDVQYWGFVLIPLLWLRKKMVAHRANHEDIIQKGFKPPHACIHALLKTLMVCETFCWRRPPLGTSLIAVAVKN